MGTSASEGHQTAKLGHLVTIRTKPSYRSKAILCPFVRFTDANQTKLVAQSRDMIANSTKGDTAMRILKHNIIGENGIRFVSQVMKPGSE